MRMDFGENFSAGSGSRLHSVPADEILMERVLRPGFGVRECGRKARLFRLSVVALSDRDEVRGTPMMNLGIRCCSGGPTCVAEDIPWYKQYSCNGVALGTLDAHVLCTTSTKQISRPANSGS